MRLGQLSRKLNVKPQEITAFIEREFNEQINNHPNCKIADEYIDKIIGQFEKAPIDLQNEPISEIRTESISIEENIEVTEKLPTNEDLTLSEEPKDSMTNDEENAEVEQSLNVVDGIIKAPKISVSGVKVVGKIELPQPTPEPTIEDTEENNEVSSESDNEVEMKAAENKEKQPETVSPNFPAPKVDKKQTKKTSHKKSPRRKVIDYKEEERLKLERYEKKKAAEAKRKKQKGKKHYEQQVVKKSTKASASTTKKRKKHQKNTSTTPQQPKPKTLWGKFMRWLNT